ncbi:VWA domain-containing protein [Kutzneria sp. CA-103260]|uniref:VWA domain-containing protein n=1 Tax=Kutzneria sp. CA-103260 TaxID=2802641 RepID=UPI001BA5DBF7|nr:vWA domain-containing protein [Kutzneria sp. CA-103260]QUQ63864.1 hypothetical protein JJ691_15810 [Kutzneria sp. CA-103260]
MRRARGLIISALLALTVTVGPLPTVNLATAAAQSTGTAALDQVASCLNDRGRLNVLALVDESSSLQSSDRTARRVDALVGMLRSLGRYGTEGQRTVQVQLAGFGTGFNAGSWVRLDQQSTADLENQARAFAGRNKDNDTDFVSALLGAQQQFAAADAAVAQGDQPPCRLLVLFTDGVYDLGTTSINRPYAPGIPPDDVNAIMAQGRHFLCDPGNLVDQLRSAGTTIVAVGLVPPGASAADQGFLQSIAERDAPGQRCGAQGSPPGKYYPVTSLEQLLQAFDALVQASVGGTSGPGPQPVPVCTPGAASDARCTETFDLDQSLREFHLLLGLGAPGIVAYLQPPSGSQSQLKAGTFQLAGTTLTVSSLTDLDLVVDGTLPPDSSAWVGRWTVRFVDTTGQNAGALAQTQITVFGSLVPVVRPAPAAFPVAERTPFTIKITDAAGSPRTPADFVRSATISAVVTDPGGGQHTVHIGPAQPDGSYRAEYEVPTTDTESYVDLKVTLDVVTSGGLSLRPRSTTYRVPVLQPSSFPKVSPVELRLKTITDSGAATGTMTLTGGVGASGCVWFAGTNFGQVPPNVGRVTTTFTPNATNAQQCLHLSPGQRQDVAVAAAPEQVRSGIAKGQIAVMVTADNGTPRRIDVPVSFEMQRPLNTSERDGLFLLILLGGILLPLLLLWLVSWWTAKFREPGQLRHAELDVVVTPNGVRCGDTGSPLCLVLDAQSFRDMPAEVPPVDCRRFDCGALSLHRRISLAPWLLPYGLARQHGRQVLTAAGSLSRARVGFELADTWVFVIDSETSVVEEDGFRVAGRLHLFLSDFELPSKVTRLVEQVERTLPARVRAVADRIGPPSDPEAVVEDEIYHPPA